VIEVKNLTFSYGKDKQALHGLDFTVEDGEIFGFLGPNGSGKSTTQKILTGILKGHGGKVSLFGQDISAAHGQEFFQKIGVLFEFPYLYANLSAVDNLHYFASFYPKEQRRDVRELLEKDCFFIENIDATIIAQAPKMRPHIDAMRENIAKALDIDISQVNVKATTEEGLGFTGEGAGMAAQAAALIFQNASGPK